MVCRAEQRSGHLATVCVLAGNRTIRRAIFIGTELKGPNSEEWLLAAQDDENALATALQDERG
jgi:hypothetical protein